jgi:NDP-sugar pyrophosphorylase family protein
MSEQINLRNIEQEKRELFKQTTLLINAGGRGTRLEPILEKKSETGITKALIEMGGQSLLDYHLKHAVKLGYRKVVISAGDHENIRDYLADKDYGIPVETLLVKEQRGNGGDLLEAVKSQSDLGDQIIVQNVDSFVLLDEAELLNEHKKSGRVATIVVSHRQGVPNQDAWFIDQDNKVVKTLEGEDDGSETDEEFIKRASSTGMVVFDTEWLKEYKNSKQSISIYADMLPSLVSEGKLGAFDNGELLFYDVGTPASFAKTVANPAFVEAINKYY